MGGNDLIAFEDLAKLPAGHDVGDAAVFLDAADAHLGNQTAVAVDQQFAILQQALVFTDVQDDEMPLGISHEDFAFQTGWEGDEEVFILVEGQFGFQLLDVGEENFILAFTGGQISLKGFVLLVESRDLLGRKSGGLIGGQFLLRFVSLLFRFVQVLGQLIGLLGEAGDVRDGFVALSGRSLEGRLGLLEFGDGFIEFFFGCRQVLFGFVGPGCLRLRLVWRVVIFSLTLTKFRPPTASPAIIAMTKLILINMVVYLID
jgi:hypothetical protein